MNDNNEALVEENKSSGCTNTSCCPPKNPIVRDTPKVGRNDPCICGNGRKYKKCCGK
ncbi:MAG: SEC-C metal-binding domain-containing protein [Paraglaciecola sp.]|uniref:SEC-C metal-binding domain-containing protein n=1 Tax=Paraglaciecola sp. TaxID=1920173 RepID=UPI003266730A